MLNRWIGICSVILLLSVHAALIYRDLLPTWLAGSPPVSDSDLRRHERRRIQLGIFDSRDRLVGRSWTVAELAGLTLHVESSTLLLGLQLPGGVQTPPARIDTSLLYDAQRRLDRLSIRVLGLAAGIELTGELVPPDMFPCRWRVGPLNGQFLLDADLTRALGDVIRPFDRLEGLYVGRTWLVKLFNPLGHILPTAAGAPAPTPSMNAVLVRVTGRETIEHAGEHVYCFRVDAERATAWVAPDGRVLRQVVELPLLGRLTLLDQPFDEDAYRRALERFRAEP